MPNLGKTLPPLDYGRLAECHGFAIPPQEARRVQAILAPLVKECRASYGEGLDLVEPVGTFCVEGPDSSP